MARSIRPRPGNRPLHAAFMIEMLISQWL